MHGALEDFPFEFGRAAFTDFTTAGWSGAYPHLGRPRPGRVPGEGPQRWEVIDPLTRVH